MTGWVNQRDVRCDIVLVLVENSNFRDSVVCSHGGKEREYFKTLYILWAGSISHSQATVQYVAVVDQS